jgi:hypothetical protein
MTNTDWTQMGSYFQSIRFWVRKVLESAGWVMILITSIAEYGHEKLTCVMLLSPHGFGMQLRTT